MYRGTSIAADHRGKPSPDGQPRSGRTPSAGRRPATPPDGTRNQWSAHCQLLAKPVRVRAFSFPALHSCSARRARWRLAPKARAHAAAPAGRRKGAVVRGAAHAARPLGALPPAPFGSSSAQLPPPGSRPGSVQPVPREAAPPVAPPVSPTGRVSARRSRCAETQAQGAVR